MSAAVPNHAAMVQQTDAALAALLDDGTPDATIANLIEAVHGLARRMERLEAMAPQYSAPLPANTTANPAGSVTMTPAETAPEPAVEEASDEHVSSESAAND